MKSLADLHALVSFNHYFNDDFASFGCIRIIKLKLRLVMLTNLPKETWLSNPLGYISLKRPKIADLGRIFSIAFMEILVYNEPT